MAPRAQVAPWHPQQLRVWIGAVRSFEEPEASALLGDDALFNAELAKGMASGETAFNAEGRGPEGEFHGEVGGRS